MRPALSGNRVLLAVAAVTVLAGVAAAAVAASSGQNKATQRARSR